MASIKINSSVVKFNLLVILTSIFTVFATWFTDNQAALEEVLGSPWILAITSIISVVNVILRTTNLRGLPPVEIVKKE